MVHKKKKCKKENTRVIEQNTDQEEFKSATSEHGKRDNPIIDLEKPRSKEEQQIPALDEEGCRDQEGWRMENLDEGAYMLTHTWNSFLSENRGWGCLSTSRRTTKTQ